MAGKGGSFPVPNGHGPRGGFTVLVDGESLAAVLANREQLARAAHEYLALSDMEFTRLYQLNGILEDQVAALQSQVVALSAEVSLLRGQGPAAPGGRGGRPY